VFIKQCFTDTSYPSPVIVICRSHDSVQRNFIAKNNEGNI